jgi:hypothetical protein
MGLLDWFRRHRQRAVVLVDDTGVTHRRPDGIVESISWSDLQEVGVLTTDEGPLLEDVFFVLRGSGRSGLVVEQGAAGSHALVERLVKLPRFDERLFIEAMGSTSNRTFVCWRRESKIEI